MAGVWEGQRVGRGRAEALRGLGSDGGEGWGSCYCVKCT